MPLCRRGSPAASELTSTTKTWTSLPGTLYTFFYSIQLMTRKKQRTASCTYGTRLLSPPSCLQNLNSLKVLTGEVCSKIKNRPTDTILGKTWTFSRGKGSLRVLLTKGQWESLLSYLEVPAGLTATHAEQVRSTIMNAPQRIDHRHRKLFEQIKPSWRMCTAKFRQDGILLAFGHPRSQYTIPIP